MKVEKYTKSVDDLVTDLLVATLYETDRPPRNVSGLVDWRLNGFISRLLVEGKVTGGKEEYVLLPLSQRLPARRLLLVGLGQLQDFTILQARHVAFRIGKTIRGLSAVDVALSIPPASDERNLQDTERSVFEVLRQCDLPEGLLIRWLIPPTTDFLPFPPDLHVGGRLDLGKTA